MSTLGVLVRHEARESRLSLLVAPCVSLAVLASVHVLMPLDYAVAQGAASCVGILVALWTVYFAADLFATDCASGRMRTKSLMPVGAFEIWRAKIAFYALAVGGIGAWTYGCEYALQRVLGSPESLAYFHEAIGPLAAHAPFLAMVAASAILCSLLVDSALVALLCSAGVGLALAGLGVLVSDVLSAAGIVPGPTERSAAQFAGALLLLALSAFAFARGQARIGARGVRLRVVLSTVGIALLLGGGAGATEVYRRITGALDDPRTSFQAARASPDGRWLAVEVVGPQRLNGSRGNGTPSVWVIDLTTRESELVAWPACLRRDWLSGGILPWIDATSFRAERLNFEDLQTTEAEVRIARIDEAWDVTEHESGMHDESRIAPTWAETVLEKRDTEGTYARRVRWIERGIEREFVGDGIEVSLRHGLFVSPTPGRVLVLREGVLSWIDLEDDRAVVLASDVVAFHPSPGGSAILFRNGDGVHVLSTVDGRPLRDPWPKGHAVAWISGEGDSRAVIIHEIRRDGRTFVEDVNTGVSFELEGDSWSTVHRLGDGRYVYVDRDSDVVIVGAHGERDEILVDR